MTTCQHPSAPELPEFYATFSGLIDQGTVQRLIQGLSLVTGQCSDVHLLFQSSGGYIGDGICLYNFFKALPFNLTLYNTGSVSSIAVIAYLGAKRRMTSKYATFMIHRSTWTGLATAAKLQAAVDSLHIDDKRTEDILRSHIKLSTEQWAALNYVELTFNAEEAVRVGMADEIADFIPPAGAKIFTV